MEDSDRSKEITCLDHPNTFSSSLTPNKWSRKWSPQEDARLLKAIHDYGFEWNKIADAVQTRDYGMFRTELPFEIFLSNFLLIGKCYQRWDRVLRPDRIKGQWSAEEDEKLIALIAQGVPNWGQIAKKMEGRTCKQCRERWINYLDPELKHYPWTVEEDSKLVSLQSQLGNHWAMIAREMPGRSENAVRGRFIILTKELKQSSAPHIIIEKRKRSRVDQDPNDSKDDDGEDVAGINPVGNTRSENTSYNFVNISQKRPKTGK